MFTSKIANYLGNGNEIAEYPDDGWAWNVLHLKVARYQVRIIQSRDILRNKIEAKGMIYSSDIEVFGVSSYEEGERVINDLCRILSLASFSQVVPFYYSFNGVIRKPRISAEAMYFRPLIDIKNGEAVKIYIEKVWSKYRKTKRTRRLGEIIDMLMIVELPVQPLEVQLAQIFIIFENLKSTYAKSKKIPFHEGFYRKTSNPKKSLKSEPILSFKTLLNMMFSDVGMNPSLKKIINLRNEIIHFGLSRKPYQSLIKDYDYCHDLVREYLLRILNYDGDYFLYSHAARTIQKLDPV